MPTLGEEEHTSSEEKLPYVGMSAIGPRDNEGYEGYLKWRKTVDQSPDDSSSSLNLKNSKQSQVTTDDSRYQGSTTDSGSHSPTYYGFGCLSCACGGSSSGDGSSLLSVGMFAAVFCVALTFESFCSNGVNPTNYQTLETRYSFSSTASGVISTMFDVAYCVLAVPIVYFGSRYLTKPKWLAFGLTLVSIGCFTMALPQFISGRYVVSASLDFKLCDANRSQLYCEATSGEDSTQQDSSIIYPIILGAGNFLLGAGTVAQNSLAVHYFEENSGNGGFYYGLLQAFRGIGSILGAGSNAVFLRIPVDLKHLDVDNSHTLWVGAWWLGLLIGAIAVFLFVPFVAAFPAKFDNEYTRSHRTEADKRPGPSSSVKNSVDDVIGCEKEEGEERSLRQQLAAIFGNVAWVVYNFASVPEAIIYSGVVTFGAKYFQQNLAMSPSIAAMTFACVILFGIFGTVTGAVISKKLQSIYSFIKVLMLVSVVELLLSSVILIHCPQQSLHSTPSDDTGCASTSNCQCSPTLFEPVCDSVTGISYFSSCYAGCQSEDLTHCSCLVDYSQVNHTNNRPSDSSTDTNKQTVDDGLCLESCWQKPIAVVGMSLFCFMMLAKVPIGMAGSLKLLASTDLASLALAITNILLRVMGMCTGPLLFGALLDNNCEVWELTCDQGNKGSCLIYGVSELSFQLFVVIMSCAACPLLVYSITLLVYNRTTPSASFSLSPPPPSADDPHSRGTTSQGGRRAGEERAGAYIPSTANRGPQVELSSFVTPFPSDEQRNLDDSPTVHIVSSRSRGTKIT